MLILGVLLSVGPAARSGILLPESACTKFSLNTNPTIGGWQQMSAF